MVNEKTYPQKRKTIHITDETVYGWLAMKFFSVLYIVFILLIGCNSPSSDIPPNVDNVSDLDDPKVRNAIFEVAINETDLKLRRNPSGEKIYHAPNEEQPYTGWVKNIRKLQQFQDGKKHGIYVSWYGNWQKIEEGHYKNGLRDGVWILWSPIGQKESEGTYKDGKRDGLWTLWDSKGEKEREITYKDGSVLISASIPQMETDTDSFDEHSGKTVPLAFVLRKSTQGAAQLGLPKGAKLRIGQGKVNDIQISPDGSRIFLATSIGIWLYDAHSGEVMAFPGDTGSVKKIFFSPDGKILASIGGNRLSIYLWDIVTGQQKNILTGHNASVNKVLFSPDRNFLLSMSQHSRINTLWDLHTGKQKQTINGSIISFSPDGAMLYILSRNSILLWDTLTGQHLETLTWKFAGRSRVLSSPDGIMLAGRGSKNTVSLFNLHTGQQKDFTTVRNTNTDSTILFSPDGKTLAIGSRDGTVSLWDTSTGKRRQSLTKQEYWISALTFSPDGEILATASGGTIQLWDVRSGQLMNILRSQTNENENMAHHFRHQKSITNLIFNHDGTILVSQSEDNNVWLWNIRAAKQKKLLSGLGQSVDNLSFNSDGSTLASSGYDYTINLWDFRTGKKKKILKGHSGSVSSLSFSPDGTTLASGSADGTIRFWNTRTEQVDKIIKGFTRPVDSLAFSTDGTLLASGSWDGDLRLWDVRTGEQKKTLIGHRSIVFMVTFSKDGRNLVSCEQNSKTIYLWNVHTGELKNTLKGHTHNISCVLFSPDGKTIASGDRGDTIRLWDVQTGEHVKTIYCNSVSSLSFSPDGNTIACASWSPNSNSKHSIHFFNVKTGMKKATFAGHTDHIYSVLFSPDGKTLVSTSQDGTMIWWDVAAATKTANGAE